MHDKFDNNNDKFDSSFPYKGNFSFGFKSFDRTGRKYSIL